ncbi:hypothetical protein [Fodinibius salsisoli]|uniref:Lipoprotein n=1 Tax=Fodinibius salsisoli TaxID=2820877 RepID=A0ABT3PR55_9BACT|nr:hypothetical protein [Fodinibius salsisoli]MCW9708321.1 hypothetical protein [Fodinibius salsisoli]
MIRQFILFIFFCSSLLGCQDTINNIEDPQPSVHKLQVDGEIQFHEKILWSASDDSLFTTIEVENIGTDTARIETGPCAFNVVAYNESSEPIWYNRTTNNYICPDELFVYNIAPKETQILTGQLYISGENWYWDLPDGSWSFKIEGHTEKGTAISFSANEIKLH